MGNEKREDQVWRAIKLLPFKLTVDPSSDPPCPPPCHRSPDTFPPFFPSYSLLPPPPIARITPGVLSFPSMLSSHTNNFSSFLATLAGFTLSAPPLPRLRLSPARENREEINLSCGIPLHLEASAE